MTDFPEIHVRPLAYEQTLEWRPPESIDLVVIHSTELPDLNTARQFGEKILYPQSGSGNSGHFYIDRDGRVERWVQTSRIAHHVRGFNSRSLGIELVNLGRYPDWLHAQAQIFNEAYQEEQINSLIGLLGQLSSTLPSLRWIAGHEDLDLERVPASNDSALTVRRKLDPGPLFPWGRLATAILLQRLFPASEASAPVSFSDS